jgi:hypothetical protein
MSTRQFAAMQKVGCQQTHDFRCFILLLVLWFVQGKGAWVVSGSSNGEYQTRLVHRYKFFMRNSASTIIFPHPQ